MLLHQFYIFIVILLFIVVLFFVLKLVGGVYGAILGAMVARRSFKIGLGCAFSLPPNVRRRSTILLALHKSNLS